MFTIKNKTLLRRFTFFFRIHLSLLILAILFLILAGFYPIVRFPEEQIDIEIYPNHVWVKGIYVYKNPLPIPVRQSFTIPLTVDADHPEPFFLSANVVTPRENPITLKYLLGVHRFSLKFDAKEEITVSVKYRQQTPTKNARYILISTKAWRRPLNRGLYRIFLNNVHMTSSSYTLNQSDSFLFFRKEHFMPSKDWIFSWEVI